VGKICYSGGRVHGSFDYIFLNMKKAVQILLLSAFLLTFMLTKTINVMQDTEEIWKPVVGYEGFYKCSTEGRVMTLARPKTRTKIIKPQPNGSGYLFVRLYNNAVGKPKKIYVHRLIAETFLGKSTMTVDHINNNRSDNRLLNLRYLSQHENVLRRSESRDLPTGIYKTNKGKFIAHVPFDIRNSKLYLGIYSSLDEAKAAIQAIKR
jgi:hypothetical protein